MHAPWQTADNPDGRSLKGRWDLDVRTWGDRLDGSTVLLIGTYMMCGEVNGRLLDALPPLLSLTQDVWDCPLTPILAEAIARHVGYGSAFALSSAFERVYGVSPQEHRTRAA